MTRTQKKWGALTLWARPIQNIGCTPHCPRASLHDSPQASTKEGQKRHIIKKQAAVQDFTEHVSHCSQIETGFIVGRRTCVPGAYVIDGDLFVVWWTGDEGCVCVEEGTLSDLSSGCEELVSHKDTCKSSHKRVLASVCGCCCAVEGHGYHSSDLPRRRLCQRWSFQSFHHWNDPWRGEALLDGHCCAWSPSQMNHRKGQHR